MRCWFTLALLRPIQRTLSEHGIARVRSGLRFNQDGASPFVGVPLSAPPSSRRPSARATIGIDYSTSLREEVKFCVEVAKPSKVSRKRQTQEVASG